ncbi:MAG: argininosuccinate lyase [Clostridia bacterium]|nr:argininosuccinate lyase [Clostridia bacterium]
MAKLWAGRTDGVTSRQADDFNSSIRFDSRMYREDITGSIAHAKMLAKCSILTPGEAETIIEGLCGILSDLETGKLPFDPDSEDVHMFVEETLTKRIGDAGKKLHTARSRNDQVALDLRLYLKNEGSAILAQLKELVSVIAEKAEASKALILPGYTHLQHAQPITFGHHLSAYAYMFLRDADRIRDALARTDLSPIGSCALAGTTYPTDRAYEAELLGFSGIVPNSIDGVSDRDFAIEFLSALAILMMHLSRFSEEIVLWSSSEFGFLQLSDAYTTGSSIMPQKKNPDMAELVRGKTGRVYGDLMAILTVFKGLPLAYNKDMQEDKESVFDACDTVRACLPVFTGMLATAEPKAERMLSAAKEGFLNATDLADYLTKKGMPFRDAYRLSGRLVAEAIREGRSLEDLPLETYKSESELFDADLYGEIGLAACVNKRRSAGGTSVSSVEAQLAEIKEKIKKI